MKAKNLVKFSKENDVWECKEIEGTETPNDNKNYIERIPGFDEETYPFLICAGRVETWLINVKNLKAQTLFTKSSMPYFS